MYIHLKSLPKFFAIATPSRGDHFHHQDSPRSKFQYVLDEVRLNPGDAREIAGEATQQKIAGIIIPFDLQSAVYIWFIAYNNNH